MQLILDSDALCLTWLLLSLQSANALSHLALCTVQQNEQNIHRVVIQKKTKKRLSRLVLSVEISISTLQPAAQLNNTTSSITVSMVCHTSRGRKGAGQVEAFWARVFPWCFYWPQQMASLSLRIVLVAILLWLSGLTIAACNCGGQKKPFTEPEKCLLSHWMVNIVKIYRCLSGWNVFKAINWNSVKNLIPVYDKLTMYSTLCLDFEAQFFSQRNSTFPLFFPVYTFLFGFDTLVSSCSVRFRSSLHL